MPASASPRTSAQINNSLTYLWGDHAIKGGFDIQHVSDTRTSTPFQLYTFATTAAYQAAASGAESVRLQHLPAVLRRARPGLLVEPLRLFVQDDWRLSDSLKVLYGLRYDLYDVPAPNASRAVRDLARLRGRQEQLGAAARRGLERGQRSPHGHARQHRHDVRPGAAGQLRAGAHQRRHQRPRPRPPSSRRTPGAPALPERAVGRRRRRAEHADHGGARLPGRQQLAEQRAGRAAAERSLRRVGRRVLRPRLQPAGDQQHQPDQPDRPALRRPQHLQPGGQRQHPRRPALQRRQRGAVDRRVDLQER